MSAAENGQEDINFSKKNMTKLKTSNINRDYIMEGLIGSGSYGEVRMATNRRSK